MTGIASPIRPEEKPGSHRALRWLFLLSVAVAAVCWKTQTVLSSRKRASRSLSVSRPPGAIGTRVPDRSVHSGHTQDSGEIQQAARIAVNASDEGVIEPETLLERDLPAGDHLMDAELPSQITWNGDSDTPVGISTRPEETPQAPEIGIGWIKGDRSAACPDAFPIKGNASSKIYHRPGESSYEKTIPEFCFATEEDAKAEGFRPRAR